MKITTTGSAVVLTSTIKKEDLNFMKKVNPDACVLFEEKKEDTFPVFAIGFNPREGSVSHRGIMFDSVDAEGNLQITSMMPPEVPAAARRSVITDKYMVACTNLLEVERQFSAAVADAKAQRTEFESMVEEV